MTLHSGLQYMWVSKGGQFCLVSEGSLCDGVTSMSMIWGGRIMPARYGHLMAMSAEERSHIQDVSICYKGRSFRRCMLGNRLAAISLEVEWRVRVESGQRKDREKETRGSW